MRYDMSEVLIERPRKGTQYKYPKGSRKRFQNTPLEEQAKREGIRTPWNRELGWDTRCNNKTDLLGPLNRWLHKQKGRNWDKVYSEIAQNMPTDSMAKSHVRDHIVGDFVTLAADVVMVDGKPYHKRHRYYSDTLMAIESTGRRFYFYVHPDTNILCLAPMERNYREKHNRKEKWTWENENTVNMLIDDIWYEVTVKPWIQEQHWEYGLYDAVFDRNICSSWEASRIYGKSVVGVSKRQLNKKQIRKRGLWESLNKAA